MNKRKWLVIVLALVMVLTMMPAMALAGDVEVKPGDDLQTKIDRANPGDTIVLGGDITLTDTVTIAKNITLDLNGNTITYTGSGTYAIEINNANLEIKDSANGGKISAPNRVIKVGNATIKTTGNPASLVLNGGTLESTNNKENCAVAIYANNTTDHGDGNAVACTATINNATTKGGIYLFGQGAKVTVNEGATIDVNGYYGISGNGSKNTTQDNGGTVIEINGGTITQTGAAGGGAIYHPQAGTLTISGNPVITGESGIQMCSGESSIVNITSGTFTATGSDQREGKTGDGLIPDGAAISVVDRDYPGGTPQMTISGGEFVSEQSGAVMAYTWKDNQATEWAGAKDCISISGGTFSSKPDEAYVADGYAAVANGDEFIVGTQTTEDNTTITVAPAVDETLTGEDKETATAIAEEIDTDVVTGLAGAVDENVTEINVIVEVKAVDIENETYTVSITPKDESGNEVTVTGIVTVKLPLPDGFPTKNIYVKHYKVTGETRELVEKIKADVEDDFITFKNNKGFSDFEIYVGSSSNGYVPQRTLTFDTNGGSKIDAVTENYGKTIVLADYTPKRSGYDFVGWYKDKELKEKIEYAILDYDMTVYAKWSANGEPTEDADVETKIVLVINDKTAVVDGKAVTNDVGSIIVNGRTYTPARFVAESLGAKVVWNEPTKTVTITKGDTSIVLIVDTTTAYVNGKAVKMDASAFIADGRTFTPSRFVAEQLGANVEWDETTRTVTIIQYAK